VPGPLARASIVVVVSVVLVGMYAFSFTFAQSTPDPHAVPVAVVTQGPGMALAERITATDRDEYDVHRVADRAAAMRLISQREVFAALTLGPGSPHLLLAPAAGKTTAALLAERLPAAAGLRTPPQTELIRPLATRDPNGTALDYTIFPSLIFGIVMPLLLTTVAPVLPVRRRLPFVLAFALAGGLVVTLVAHTALGALPGPWASLALMSALVLAAAAAVTSLLIGLLGPPGVVIAVLVVLITGNASSGTLLALEFMPGFYRDVGPWLPPGAAAQALRNIAYFDAVDTLRPILTLSAYVTIGLAGAMLIGERRPASQGAPSGATPDSTGEI